MTGLLFSAYLLVAVPARATAVKNPDTYTYLTTGDADSLDPAWLYDVASGLIVLNVYEPLFMFDGSSTEKLVPLIAEKVPSRENGLLSPDGRTYRIPIRKGIKFHDGTPLTPEDARYSLLRFMLYDRAAGPSPLLLEPLVGYPSTRDQTGKILPQVWEDAHRAVTVQGDDLILRLPRPYAPLLSILATWSPVVSKSWAVKNNDWDGSEAAWPRFNNSPKQSSAFFERANGTGPFQLERWDRRTKEFILTRNDQYWRAPARLKTVVVKGISEFGTRKLMLQAGDADAIQTDRSLISQLQGLPGVQIIDDLPCLDMDPVAFFTFQVNVVGNPYVGSGRLDGAGIPPDFFADADARKAFSYAFDYKGFIVDVMHGKGTQATGVIPKGLLGHNPSNKTYRLDLKKSEEHFRKALGGKLWDTGFRFTIAYNAGNIERQTFAQILKRNVEGLNPRFKIDLRAVEWPTFLDAHNASKLPIFILGWSADYPDPHDFAFPMLHSQGTFGHDQHFKDPEIDRLVEEADTETDMLKRRDLYLRIQKLEHEDAPNIIPVDKLLYRTQRDWVKGWVYNPIFPNAPYGGYFYPLYKE